MCNSELLVCDNEIKIVEKTFFFVRILDTYVHIQQFLSYIVSSFYIFFSNFISVIFLMLLFFRFSRFDYYYYLWNFFGNKEKNSLQLTKTYIIFLNYITKREGV